MATIASLNVSVKADTQQFEKAMRGAANTVSSVGKAVAAMGLAAGAAAAAGLVALTKNSMESLDTLAKLSDTIGADVQTLRAYGYAAQLAGADSETFSNALMKMQANLGNALQGGQVASDFQRLGLSVSRLAQSDATDAFAQIADAIKALPTPAARADAAVSIFGKSAQKLLPLLMSGSEGLREAKTEFDALAGTMTRLDLSRIETANDNISKLSTLMTAVGDQTANVVAPAINNTTEKLIQMAKDGGGATVAVGNGMARIRDLLSDISTVSVWLYRGWNSLSLVVQYIELGWVKFFKMFESGINYLKEQANKFGGDFEKTNFFGTWEQQTNKAIDGTIQEINRLTKALDDDLPRSAILDIFYPNNGMGGASGAGSAVSAAKSMYGELNEEGQAYLKTLQGIMSKQKAMLEQSANQIVDATRTPFEQFKSEAAKLEELILGGFLDEETVARKAKMMLDTFSDATSTTMTGGGSFRQIDTSLIDVTGLAKQGRDVQKVESPQFAEAVKLLQKINQNTANPSGGATFQ